MRTKRKHGKPFKQVDVISSSKKPKSRQMLEVQIQRHITDPLEVYDGLGRRITRFKDISYDVSCLDEEIFILDDVAIQMPEQKDSTPPPETKLESATTP